MNAGDVVGVPEEFRQRFSDLAALAEGDGRAEALAAVVELLEAERQRLPDGPAWREVVYLQQVIATPDFQSRIKRGRRR